MPTDDDHNPRSSHASARRALEAAQPQVASIRVEDKGNGTARVTVDLTLPWPAVMETLDTIKRLTGQSDQ